MKAATSILAVAASLAAVSAQTFDTSAIPQCALPCAIKSLPAECNLDPKCICENTSFIKSLVPCVQTACANDFQNAITGAQKLCSGAGVNLDVSSILAGISSSTSAPASGSTSAPATTSGPAGRTSSGSSSSGPAATTTPASAGAGRNNSTMTGTRAPSATGAGAPNAAGRNTIAFGGLAAVLGFAVVLL
ncbi:hypothetical protein ABW21_db0209210 [Orbilia brochopaga]|nr:hypothetical protein ABW21_db0209210 [Drechslerella brochopaga]